MNGPYIEAIESQFDWLRRTNPMPLCADNALARAVNLPSAKFSQMRLELHREIQRADTFFMSRQFCELVDAAHASVPDGLRFEIEWLQSRNGFLRREIPIEFSELDVPSDQFRPYIFLWSPKTSDAITVKWLHLVGDAREAYAVATPDLVLTNGQPLSSCREKCWTLAPDSPSTIAGLIKACGWFYCAFHLMAQKVALTIHQKPDRSIRRRLERLGDRPPSVVKIITLRRLEEDRARQPNPRDVNWHWQWSVRGHWRNQYYPSDRVHKPVFVEAYIKGPSDKPFKPSGIYLFRATR